MTPLGSLPSATRKIQCCQYVTSIWKTGCLNWLNLTWLFWLNGHEVKCSNSHHFNVPSSAIVSPPPYVTFPFTRLSYSFSISSLSSLTCVQLPFSQHPFSLSSTTTALQHNEGITHLTVKTQNSTTEAVHLWHIYAEVKRWRMFTVMCPASLQLDEQRDTSDGIPLVADLLTCRVPVCFFFFFFFFSLPFFLLLRN